jgi:hypothetical protein
MKLKKLKKIQIGDIDWDIVWDKESSGGQFNYQEKKIEIGTEIGDIRTFGCLLHELKEIINVEQSTRYSKRTSSEEYMFMYDHAQHDDLCARLSGLLSKFLQ